MKTAPIARVRQARQEWNRGLVGEPAAPRTVPQPGTKACTNPRCGADSPRRGAVPRGMVRVHERGEKARLYCQGWCGLYAQALADVRGIK
jgi:hypothetical protein